MASIMDMKQSTNTDKPKGDHYIPPLRFHWLTPLYDGVLKLMSENALKSRIIAEIGPGPGNRILDMGCGTGTLTIMLKKACPEAEVIGLDLDAKALDIAKRKSMESEITIELFQGSILNPPERSAVTSNSFDHIASSLVFHHLTTAEKRQAFTAAFRLLKPGGKLVIGDWGKAANPVMRLAFLAVQLLDGFKTTSGNVQGIMPNLIDEAGFADTIERHTINTGLGTFSIYAASKPNPF